MVALTELVGGLMLIFGFFTRFAALAVTIFMINAVWFTSTQGLLLDQWQGSEFSILLLVVALVFLVRGGGNLSIDREDEQGALGAFYVCGCRLVRPASAWR